MNLKFNEVEKKLIPKNLVQEFISAVGLIQNYPPLHIEHFSGYSNWLFESDVWKAIDSCQSCVVHDTWIYNLKVAREYFKSKQKKLYFCCDEITNT